MAFSPGWINFPFSLVMFFGVSVCLACNNHMLPSERGVMYHSAHLEIMTLCFRSRTNFWIVLAASCSLACTNWSQAARDDDGRADLGGPHKTRDVQKEYQPQPPSKLAHVRPNDRESSLCCRPGPKTAYYTLSFLIVNRGFRALKMNFREQHQAGLDGE